MGEDMVTRVWAVPGAGDVRAYWTGPDAPRLFRALDLGGLEHAYRRGQGRHWFDPAAARWFGVSFRELCGSSATVERHDNAPDSLRYGVTLWAVGLDGLAEPLVSWGRPTLAAARESAMAAQADVSWLLLDG